MRYGIVKYLEHAFEHTVSPAASPHHPFDSVTAVRFYCPKQPFTLPVVVGLIFVEFFAACVPTSLPRR